MRNKTAGQGFTGGDNLSFRLTVRGVQDAKDITFDRILTWEWVEIRFSRLFEDPSQAECTLTAGGTFTLTLPAVKQGNLERTAELVPGLSPSPGYDGRLLMLEPFFWAGSMAAHQPNWIHCSIDSCRSPVLVYADKAGTVKAVREAPYDASRTESYDLVLEEGWNTIIASYGPEVQAVTYVTCKWPSPDSWRWMLETFNLNEVSI